VGSLIAVVHELCIGADLAVVAGNEFEKAQDAPFVHSAKNEGEFASSSFFDVFAKPIRPSRSPLVRSAGFADVEIDETHRQHVICKKSKLVFAVVWFVSKASHKKSMYSCSFGVLKESGK